MEKNQARSVRPKKKMAQNKKKRKLARGVKAKKDVKKGWVYWGLRYRYI